MIAWLRYLKRLLKMPWSDSSWSPYWALEGEDILVALFLRPTRDKRNTATYVDIGAHQPRRFSTTYALYRCGWRGLLVEPNPSLAAQLRRRRPNDVVEQCGVSDTAGEMNFYLYAEPSYSTFSEVQKQRLHDNQKLSPIRTIITPVVTLAELQAAHPKLFQQARLLKVDAEGHDLNVLRSNDWNRFRPEYVVVEMLGQSARTAPNHEIGEFLRSQGYGLRSFLYHSAVWERLAMEAPSGLL